MFDITVEYRLGERTIKLDLKTDARAVALVGPSGVGKTSVLHMIAGLIRPDRGRVRIAGRTLFDDGVDVPIPARRAGYVFQDARLFPHRRVAANLAYGAVGRPVAAMAARLGIEHLLARWPATLSGGEMRRVAIGRALMSDPLFLLLDEPTAGLDQARAGEVIGLIEQIRDESSLPVLLVTHDRAAAEQVADEVVEMGFS